jgi:hypothetical protein
VFFDMLTCTIWTICSKATQIRKRKLEHLTDKENELQGKAEEYQQQTKRAKVRSIS